jgi:hypothetical protein
VNKINFIIIFFIVFIITAVFLRLTGIAEFSGSELLSYLFMISGIALVYSSFGLDKRGILFIGSTLFLIGIIIFINAKFDLEDNNLIVFPSVLFIAGIGFLLLYLDDTSHQIFLIGSLIFIAGGILYMLFFRMSSFPLFFTSLWNILKSYWIFIILAAGIIFILRFSNTDS